MVTQLLLVYHSILDTLAGGQEVDAIHLDLSKAFDWVPQAFDWSYTCSDPKNNYVCV
jgi:hypothetical protein